MAVSSAIEVDISSLTFETLNKIRGYLKRMIDTKGSDLHIKANAVVRARIQGEITPLSGEILSKEELDALVAQEAKRIESGESALTQPNSGGGLSLGEALLASAAGAIIGSWIGSKLFNNPNYQQNRQRGYKSPSAYQRSVNSFNKAKQAKSSSRAGTTRSGFFGSKSGTSSRSIFGS